jgi:hypothetical protein
MICQLLKSLDHNIRTIDPKVENYDIGNFFIFAEFFLIALIALQKRREVIIINTVDITDKFSNFKLTSGFKMV